MGGLAFATCFSPSDEKSTLLLSNADCVLGRVLVCDGTSSSVISVENASKSLRELAIDVIESKERLRGSPCGESCKLDVSSEKMIDMLNDCKLEGAEVVTSFLCLAGGPYS
jgi:hypothetical protein